MQLCGPESVAALNELRGDVEDAPRWLRVAEAQRAPAAKIEVLGRAVATIPQSEDLWMLLIDTKINHLDHSGLLELLKDALALFPQNLRLWQHLFGLFPSLPTFKMALRQIDNAFVWQRFREYLKTARLSESEASETEKHYLEFMRGDARAVAESTRTLLAQNYVGAAAELLLSTAISSSTSNWSIWEPVVAQTTSLPLLEAALARFPDHDGDILPCLAHATAAAGDRFRAGALLQRALEHPSSVAMFKAIFDAAVDWFEAEIAQSMRQRGQGSIEVARLLSQYSNILRRRPMYLSDVAVRERPNSVQLWLDRAALWQGKPHIAADVLESALATVRPFDAVDGSIVDLHIEYAGLLIANGSSPELADATLRAALKVATTNDERARIYTTLADVFQQAQNLDTALAVLAEAIAVPALRRNTHVWTHYISVLVETSSPCLIDVFSRCCVNEAVTMRIVLIVARAFAAGSANQLVVFNKGVSLFPTPMVLPLWKHYLVAVNEKLSIHELRALYTKAFTAADGFKKSYEDLAVLYATAERTRREGSPLLARRVLAKLVDATPRLDLWQAYIATFSELADKRAAFEAAIQRLDDADASSMARDMAYFENHVGEPERAAALEDYAVQLLGATRGSPDAAPQTVNFVPAEVEMSM